MTLSELYHFKKNDTWGQVFEGQAKADAIREVVERQQKEVKKHDTSLSFLTNPSYACPFI